MRRFASIVAASCIASAAAACSTTSSPSGGAADGGKFGSASKLTIAWLSNSQTTPFTVAVTRGARREAARLGVKLVVTDAQFKTDKQQNDLQDVISQRVDGIVLLPVDGLASQTLVNQASNAGVPVVATQSEVGDPKTRPLKDVYPKLVALVTQDEELAGAQAGALVKKVLPGGGKIAVILGAPGYAENTLRTTQFKKVLASGSSKYKVVAQQPGNWVAPAAQSACANILASNPDVKLFYSLYDDMSVGCAKAISTARSNATIVSIGGNKSGIAPITAANSPIKATVCYQPETMGALALRTMFEQLKGTAKHKADFISYKTFGVTKSNVSSCPPQA